MSEVRVHNFAISLDGFGTGDGQAARCAVRPRRGAAARVDVRHPLLDGDGRQAGRHRGCRPRLRAAPQPGLRRRDHGRRQVRPSGLAGRPRLEGLVGPEPAVPLARVRAHPPASRLDRDGGRHHVPLPRRHAGRGARAGSGGGRRAGRADRRRGHGRPRLRRRGPGRPPAPGSGADRPRPRRPRVGRARGTRGDLRHRGDLDPERRHAPDLHRPLAMSLQVLHSNASPAGFAGTPSSTGRTGGPVPGVRLRGTARGA